MIDPAGALIAAALFAAGWLTGRLLRLRATPKQPHPWCLCEHHYGTHDPETGACRGGEYDRLNYADEWVGCRCVRYTGPQPVEQYWVPPAADMSIVTAPREVDR